MAGVNTEKPLRLSRHEPTPEGESMKLFARLQELPANTRSLTWLTLAVPLLFACGQKASVPANPNPYAGGISYPWTYTAPEGQLSAQSLTPGTNTLSFEPLLAARNAWGPIELDRSNGEQDYDDGKTLILNGKTYARGFGVHSNSEMKFNLKGIGATCNLFTSDIGVDDEVGSKGNVIFQAFLDNVKAYDSGTMTGASTTKKIDIDLTDKRELRLVVTDAGNGISYDHADWANPQIGCQATRTSGSGDGRYGINGLLKIEGNGVLQEPSGALLIIDGYGREDFVLKRRLPDGRITQVSTNLANSPTDVNSYGSVSALLSQPDGRIGMAGAGQNSDRETSIVLVHRNNDLSLDTSFGTGGKTITPFRADFTIDRYPTSINSIALTPDGEIVVGGEIGEISPGFDFATQTNIFLARYNSSGQMDKAFGKDGMLIIRPQEIDKNLPYPTRNVLNSIAVQPDGKIVLAIRSNYDSGVAPCIAE